MVFDGVLDNYNMIDWHDIALTTTFHVFILSQEVAQTNPMKELESKGFFDNENKQKQQNSNGRISGTNKSAMPTAPNNNTTKPTEHVGFAVQTKLLLERELKNLVRDKISFVIKVVSNLAFGLLFGLIFFQVGKSDYMPYPEVMASFGAISNLLISTMFGVAQSSLMELPRDRPVFLRE